MSDGHCTAWEMGPMQAQHRCKLMAGHVGVHDYDRSASVGPGLLETGSPEQIAALDAIFGGGGGYTHGKHAGLGAAEQRKAEADREAQAS